MNSSPNSTEPEATAGVRQPLAADGGLEQRPGRPADPFAALDELMVVVEALCPRWPAREPCEPMTNLRL
ncbi:MAG: hypothetical protein EPO25_15755 [Gammaproteobacteria bacterium]|nr:MAG: hypothetical protein EPO25_15755 [Gammaproteobacteria bacterium]